MEKSMNSNSKIVFLSIRNIESIHKRIFPIMFCFVLSLFYFQPALAQDSSSVMKPVKYKNVKWCMVDEYAIKEGKVEEFLNSINKFLVQAGKEAGEAPEMILIHRTGPWDVTIISPMIDGPSDLEWKSSPRNNIRAGKFLKMVGKQKAMELFQQYQSDITHHDSYIAMQEDISTDDEK
jgi:hypothetical protein